MTSYIAACIDRSRTILSLLAVVISAGLMAYIGIPVESNPDVSVPIIVVTIPHEGISPEDAERLLARPMELEIKTITGVE